MTFARRRAAVILTALVVVGTITTGAAPAQAATCTPVPGTIPGTDVGVLGEEVRVPTISNITLCTDTASTPVVTVDTAGYGYCTTSCLSVLLKGDDADAGAVTVSFRADGELRSQSVDPDGVPGGGDVCVVSFGSPDAPYPGCAITVGPDGLPDPGPQFDEVVADTEARWNDAVWDAIVLAVRVLGEADDAGAGAVLQDLPGCQAVPDLEDQWGSTASFCGDPIGWMQLALEIAHVQFCEWRSCNPVTIVCALATEPC